MKIKNYDELNFLEIDTLREIGSIGTGNAATALSQLLQKEVRITMPEVRIMGYNEAIEWIGGAEEITAGVLMITRDAMDQSEDDIILKITHANGIIFLIVVLAGSDGFAYALEFEFVR